MNLPKLGHISPRRVNRVTDVRTFTRLNAAFLYSLYPTNTRKSVANDLNASPDTVRRWLDQTQAPSATWITALTLTYGSAWIDAVLYPLVVHTIEDKKNELERKKAALAREEAELDARYEMACARRAALSG
tara:strand:- start:2950 stop:3342 length:393 start_codon:yes stop_codon:yes gene_type:complete